MAVRIWYVALAAAALGIAVPALAGPPKVGEPAPDFTITTFDRKKVTPQ